MLCLKCGVIISGDWPGPYHVGCWPDFTRMPGFDMTGYDIELKEELTEIICWAAKHERRSQQVALGCSEVGNECDLRLAYKMADVFPINNHTDRWPSLVGTAVHGWMEQAVNAFEAVHNLGRWHTELEVHPSPIVTGHTDLYDSQRGLVLDWKFPSSDNVKKMRENGPSQQYITQIQLYGLGHEQAGRKVTRVGIVALARQGWLKDMYVWTTEYDRAHAQAALDRIYSLGAKLIDNDIPGRDAWGDVERKPTRLCAWCPWYNPKAQRPSSLGCPGHKQPVSRGSDD